MEKSSSFDRTLDETKLWTELGTDAWRDSIRNQRTIFATLYKDTREFIKLQVLKAGHDVVVDVGCGTGDISGELSELKCPRIGLDINPQFVEKCKKAYSHDKGVSYHMGDATKLNEWWVEKGFSKLYKKPLVICCNNTLPIMPAEIRASVVSEMQLLAGKHGKSFITLWNGRYFSHALMGYYKVNPNLCGPFDFSSKYVDWENRELQTDTGYSTKWLFPGEILRWFRSLGVEAELAEPEKMELLDHNHVREIGLGVFVWLNGQMSKTQHNHYDNDEARKFYSIWAQPAVHIGRYDLVKSNPQLVKLPLTRQIMSAQELLEAQFVKQIRSKLGTAKFRCLDMGCGFGASLRLLEREGMLWSGVGVDVSVSMIERAAALNTQAGLNPMRVEARRESFLDTSLDDETVDLVISMDGFLHVGQKMHQQALAEAWRVLRPGGWLIFTDIMQQSGVSALTLGPLLERVKVSALGTVENYMSSAKAQGFGNATFEDHSSNVESHYTALKQVLDEKSANNELKISTEYKKELSLDFESWKSFAKHLQWGTISMQKIGRPATLLASNKRKIHELSTHDPTWRATHTGIDH